MTNVSYLDVPSRVKLLLWGNPGAGKTTQAALLANAGYKVNIIDADGNLAILKSWLTEDGWKNIYAEPVEMGTKAGWTRAVELLTKDTWGGRGTIKEWGDDSVLFIDSGSVLSASCLEYCKEAAGEKGKSLDALGKGVWSDLGVKFGNAVFAVCSPTVKAHVVMTAHVRMVQDENDRMKRRPIPAFDGTKLSSSVPPRFNSIWRMEVAAGDKKMIRTESTPTMDLKNAFPKAVGKLEEANLGEIFRKIRGS